MPDAARLEEQPVFALLSHIADNDGRLFCSICLAEDAHAVRASLNARRAKYVCIDLRDCWDRPCVEFWASAMPEGEASVGFDFQQGIIRLAIELAFKLRDRITCSPGLIGD